MEEEDDGPSSSKRGKRKAASQAPRYDYGTGADPTGFDDDFNVGGGGGGSDSDEGRGWKRGKRAASLTPSTAEGSRAGGGVRSSFPLFSSPPFVLASSSSEAFLELEDDER